jgi:hypothetical protein
MYKKFYISDTRRKCTNAPCRHTSLTQSLTGLVSGVDFANSTETRARVELVLTVANHEPRVTLDLVGSIEVGHGFLEEGCGLLLGSRAGVEAELGDPDGHTEVSSSLLDLGLEAVDSSRLVDVVEVDVGGVDDRVGALLVEVGQPATRC